MERKEFSDMLVQARIDKNVPSIHAMSKLLVQTFSQVQRLECAVNNYTIRKVFEYLHVINSCLFISNDTETRIICSEAELIQWVIKKRKPMSQKALAQKAGISYATLAKIEINEAVASIDTALKIIDALGYKIEKIC